MRYTFVSFCLLLTCTLASTAQQTPDSLYHIQDSIWIPTKSGIGISATIIRQQESTEPLPVVLFHTTYHQGKSDYFFGKLSADRGYVGVITYSRGIRSDLQHYQPYENEASDIYDILDWISQQEWCNGEIGMFGGSYTGFAQWAAVKNPHPALKTIVPQVAVMPGFDFPMQNNVQLGFELNWSHTNIIGKDPIPASFLWEWYEKGYAYSKMDSVLGYTNAYFQKWLEHPAYDDYWKNLVPNPTEYASLNIPILSTTGYFDGPQISAVEYFKRHNQYNPTAEHYLVIGPYDHWGGQANPTTNLRGYEIDSVANISMRRLAFDWLDWVLQDAPKPELLQDKVNVQVMETNTWRHAPTLQALNNRTLRLHLNSQTLTTDKPSPASFHTQTVDFTNRENMNNYFHPNLIIDSLDASNGIVFSTEAFESDFAINGAFTGQLVLETNKKDVDISISFYEQMPDQSYFLLSRYFRRASYAKDNSQRQLLTPSQKETIPLRASHIVSRKIKKGSRLIIVVNVNKHPFEIINYGSGKLPANETMKDAGTPMQIKWYSDSYIEIPVWRN